ncbi:MAG: hypothetical protein COS98_00600 [Parcubacteria group bacterium CG07_land_8_20_14_0_80_35_11]|nr:MAG: hypothetical protein COS98_00600 [Parcubacteria group bacterium CG07_land_8_20_14_0_80_35_11]
MVLKESRKILLILIIGLFFILGLTLWKKVLTKEILLKEPISFKIPSKEILAPEPLTFLIEKETESVLSNEEIIKFTNYYREENDIAELNTNQLLMEAAENKLNDMFQKQYFAHISPEGDDAGIILKEIGYDYLVVGENLARGYFKDSKDLVDGWMKSPDHRENILNPKFREIGVAQREGKFQGKEQYLAVQIFASPLSLCPLPDESSLSQIQEKEEELEELTKKAEILRGEIEKESQEEFESEAEFQVVQDKIKTYNALVRRINKLSKELETLILNYNSQVNSFNTCIDNL